MNFKRAFAQQEESATHPSQPNNNYTYFINNAELQLKLQQLE